MDLASAKYPGVVLTPMQRQDQRSIRGAVYDHNYMIAKESLLPSKIKSPIRHSDAVTLFPEDLLGASIVDKTYLYLGHCFKHYGHFILESLPMLSYLLGDKSPSIMLPFNSGSWKDYRVAEHFIDLLDVPNNLLQLYTLGQPLIARL